MRREWGGKTWGLTLCQLYPTSKECKQWKLKKRHLSPLILLINRNKGDLWNFKYICMYTQQVIISHSWCTWIKKFQILAIFSHFMRNGDQFCNLCVLQIVALNVILWFWPLSWPCTFIFGPSSLVVASIIKVVLELELLSKDVDFLSKSASKSTQFEYL